MFIPAETQVKSKRGYHRNQWEITVWQKLTNEGNRKVQNKHCDSNNMLLQYYGLGNHLKALEVVM